MTSLFLWFPLLVQKYQRGWLPGKYSTVPLFVPVSRTVQFCLEDPGLISILRGNPSLMNWYWKYYYSVRTRLVAAVTVAYRKTVLQIPTMRQLHKASMQKYDKCGVIFACSYFSGSLCFISGLTDLVFPE